MADRWVTLICNGNGRGGHPKKRVDRVALIDGQAVSIDQRGGDNKLRRALAERAAGRPIADFDLLCTRCRRAPQVSRERMTVLVSTWLSLETHQSVVRDISDPATARML